MKYTVVLDLDEKKRKEMEPIFDANGKGIEFYGCKVICISNGHAPDELEALKSRIEKADTCETCIKKYVDCRCEEMDEDY